MEGVDPLLLGGLCALHRGNVISSRRNAEETVSKTMFPLDEDLFRFDEDLFLFDDGCLGDNEHRLVDASSTPAVVP